MIEFQNTSFSFDEESLAIDNVSLEIPEGQFVCVLGGNGSGKSTLAKLADALLLPSEGAVIVSGMRTDDGEARFKVRSETGLVFQNPDDQIVASIVENDVAFGPENLGIPLPELASRVSEALEAVHMGGKEKRETHTLSGGQKQRIAIAGALAMHPKTLILDEATAMLDPLGRATILEICRGLNKTGMTIIMVTHFMEEAVFADRVIALDRGRIILDGPPEDVLVHADTLAELNLGLPFACKLALELRKQGIDVRPCVQEEELVRQLSTLPRRDDGTDKIGGMDEIRIHTVGNGASAPTAAENAPALLEFDHVGFSYGNKGRKSLRALNDVCFSVYEGELLGIAGHTGSGKSTLLQHMNGLKHPSEGRILFRGRDLSDKKVARECRGEIGLVFQYPEHQLFADTVAKDVAFGPRNLGLSEPEVDDRVRRALHRVGLSVDLIGDKSPFDLSGGQKRRVALAGILAMEPKILVLDEPSVGLDPRGHTELVNLVSRLRKEGLTIVMVSHVMGDLARLSDRILVLAHGEVFSIGSPAEVFSPEAAEPMREIGLDIPSPQRLAMTMREHGFSLPRPMYSPQTLVEDLAAQIAPTAKQEVAHV